MKTRHPDREIYPIVLFAGTNMEAAKLKSMLDEASIYSFVRNAYMQSNKSWFSDPEESQPVSVMVAKRDEDEARSILAQFETTGIKH